MARGKKAAVTLTPEERLQQALVPVEEQPYEIPDNWCWVYLPCLCEYMRAGGDKPSVISNIKTDLCPVPIIANGIQEDGIIGYTDKENEKPRTVTVSGRGTIGYAVVRNYTYYPVVRLIVLSPNRSTLPEYIKLCFDNFEEKGTGSSIPQLTVPSLKTKRIPLPPLVEQQRIVDRIESIFANLDEAKEKAQSVVDGFELRKSAILHKAFTGELTAQWRQEHGVELDSWENIALGKCLLPMETRKPSGEYFRYIDIDAIDNKRQEVKEPKLTETAKAPSRASRAVESGNVLFSMVRPYLKNIALVDDTMNDCIASTGFYVCRCKANILPRFLYEFLCSKDAIDYLMQFMKGDNSPSIRKDDLLDMEIKLPSIAEQEELCRVISTVSEKEQQAKDAAEAVIDQIDTMKKSVLARAFRGELGTNDPTEENALELLKSIL